MENLIILFKFLIFIFLKSSKKRSKIDCVHTITFRTFSPAGGKGGGSAVQSCQNILLGDSYKDLFLKYTYFEENEFSKKWQTRLADLWGGALFAITKTKDEYNCVYITHDYGTGFGLAVLGKKFVYVSHLQGPRIEEKMNYGERMTWLDIKIIKFCENFVFRHALYVCFPSEGARDYYFKSKYRSINNGKSTIGPTLYNTIYANPQAQVVKEIVQDDSVITILSVGALTNAKGIDLVAIFLDANLNRFTKKIRWIVVGTGILKEKILNQLKALKIKNNSFDFVFVESLTYPEIRYLSNICDIYLMLHRISIFDLATLESMKEGKCIILSSVGGNMDFNKKDNILFYNIGEDFVNLTFEDICLKGMMNRQVYDEFFSNKCFIQNYHSVIDDLCK